MASLRTIALTIVITIAAVLFASQLFTLGVSNSGVASTTDVPLFNAAQGFQDRTSNFSKQMTSSVKSATSTDPTTNLVEGISVSINVAVQSVALVFDLLATTLDMFGKGMDSIVPITAYAPWLPALVIVFVTLAIVFLILQTITRWWI